MNTERIPDWLKNDVAHVDRRAFFFGAMALIGWGSVLPTVSAQDVVSITSQISFSKGQFTYSYQVTNKGTAPLWLVNIRLGGTLVPTSTSAPPGWKVKVVTDAGIGYIAWYSEGPNGVANGDYGTTAISPGQTLDGFGYVSIEGPKAGVLMAALVDGSGDVANPDVATLCAGDVNDDGIVDSLDLAAVRNGFGSKCGAQKYDPALDIDRNCIIDIADLAFVARNIGCTVSDALSVPSKTLSLGRKLQ